MNSLQIREKILNSSEPLILKKTINWKILLWSLQNWREILKDEEMEFRSGHLQSTKQPQWETQNKIIKGKFDLFLKHIESEEKTWMYFDYKYLNSFLLNTAELRNEITWGSLGFPEATSDESTIWIGSKGAHTPCHVDTYGFNLICQVYGRKLWVLFPPEENLCPTRIPYEESSIYSQLNFFSPTIQDFKAISNAHILTLEPGDVLYVPHGWWHYVENLETAISINVWLPSPEDDSARIKESLVQFLVKQVSDLSPPEIKRDLLNPNMEQILNEDPKSFFDLVLKTIDIYKKNSDTHVKKHKTLPEEKCDDQRVSKDVFIDSICVMNVPKATHKEWMDFLHNQSTRFTSSCDKEDEVLENLRNHSETCNFENLLRALTDPEVISLIHSKLLNK